MKSNQFRIGNIVGHKFTDSWKPIDKIQKTSVGTGMVSIPYEDIRLIPLTEKWLEKLGFKEQSKSEWTKEIISKDHCKQIFMVSDLCTFSADKIYDLPDDPEMYIIQQDCEYVHQLQNYYYTFTGEELEIPLFFKS